MEPKKEEESETSNIAEQAKSNAFEILKNKYPVKGQEHIYDKFGRPPRVYEEEFQKTFDEELKRLQQQNDLKKQIDDKNQKIEELTDTLKRLQAEFENFKKRNEKEKAEFAKYACADIIASILPVLDSFEIALKNTGDKDKFIEGMKIVYAQLHSILEAEGLRPIKAVNEKFDPYKHEVLMKEQSDKPDDTILEEFQKGYMLNDRVLRHSKVKISGK